MVPVAIRHMSGWTSTSQVHSRKTRNFLHFKSCYANWQNPTMPIFFLYLHECDSAKFCIQMGKYDWYAILNHRLQNLRTRYSQYIHLKYSLCCLFKWAYSDSSREHREIGYAIKHEKRCLLSRFAPRSAFRRSHFHKSSIEGRKSPESY
jgi:hypothetical protein